LDELSTRERGILTLVASGFTDSGIADRLFLSPKTIEANIASIFIKLQLSHSSETNRRVLAVLAFLRSEA
jgi:serine/threonine-protein kinase